MLSSREILGYLFLVFVCSFPLFGAQPDQPQSQLLPTGMRITPFAAKGTVLQPLNPGLASLPDFVASMAVTSAVSPDGKTLLVLTSGYNQNYDANGNTVPETSNEYVFVYDISSHTPRQTQVLTVSVNSFEGLVWNPSGNAFYVSGGPDDLLHVFVRRASARNWTEGTSISLNHNGVGLGLCGITPITAGLAITPDGNYLLAANFQNDSVSFIDLASGSVIKEFDLRPGVIDPAESGKPGGSYPYAIAVADNHIAYVSSQRDREIIVLDISALPSVSVVTRIRVAGQPNKLILSHAQNRLFVALDNVDSVAMIDIKSNRLLSSIQTIAPKSLFPNRENLHGASPNNLAISSDDQTLYVTNSGTNSVAIVSLPSNPKSPGNGP